MSTAFPGELDTLTNPTPNDSVATVSHAAQHANANDAIEALQAKVGKNSSAVETSHDFKLSEVATGQKVVSKTATQTMANKTLTSPILNTPTINTPVIEGGNHDDGIFDNPTLIGAVEIDLGSDAAGDMYYRDVSGNLARLPKGTDAEILTLVSGLPSWEPPTSGGGVLLLATRSSNVSVSTSAVKISFDTEEYDTAGAFSGGTFTAPSDGYYRVTINLNFNDSNSNNFEHSGMIYKNGSVYARGYSTHVGSNEDGSVFLSRIVSLIAGDTIECYAQDAEANATVVVSGTTQSFINIEKL